MTTADEPTTPVADTGSAPDEDGRCRIFGETLGEVTACKRTLLVTIELSHSPPVAHLYMRGPNTGWRWTAGLTLRNARRLKSLLAVVIDRLEAEEAKRGHGWTEQGARSWRRGDDDQRQPGKPPRSFLRAPQ